MSLIQFAQAKDAINFKQALEEKINEKVQASLQETKIEVASNLLGEAGGITGKMKSSKPSGGHVSGGVKPHMAHVNKKPAVGTHGRSSPEPRVPGGHLPGKSKHVSEETLDEKIITPGTVEHMAHAVHDCATGSCEPTTTRGTFSVYHTPHYAIHKDGGSINPDEPEHNYFVAGSGGMHKFSVHHSSKGVDVKHHGQVG
jgi:hypothetical protein